MINALSQLFTILFAFSLCFFFLRDQSHFIISFNIQFKYSEQKKEKRKYSALRANFVRHLFFTRHRHTVVNFANLLNKFMVEIRFLS